MTIPPFQTRHVSQGGPRKFGGPSGYGQRPRRAVLPDIRTAISAGAGRRDLVANVPGVFDQKKSSRCVAFAHCGALATDLGVAMFDASKLYPLIKCEERRRTTTGFPPLEDNGADPDDAISAIRNWGVEPWEHPELDSDDPAVVCAEPDLGSLEKAAEDRIVGLYDASDLDAILVALAQHPVTVAITVDQAMEDYDGVGVLDAFDDGRPLGGHDIYIVDASANGEELVAVNSWGRNWGRYGWLSITRRSLERRLYQGTVVAARRES